MRSLVSSLRWLCTPSRKGKEYQAQGGEGGFGAATGDSSLVNHSTCSRPSWEMLDVGLVGRVGTESAVGGSGIRV